MANVYFAILRLFPITKKSDAVYINVFRIVLIPKTPPFCKPASADLPDSSPFTYIICLFLCFPATVTPSLSDTCTFASYPSNPSAVQTTSSERPRARDQCFLLGQQGSTFFLFSTAPARLVFIPLVSTLPAHSADETAFNAPVEL